MNAIQTRYANARATYDAMDAERTAQIESAAVAHFGSEEDAYNDNNFEAMCEIVEAIAERLNSAAITAELSDAEAALLDFGAAHISKCHPAQWSQVACIFERGVRLLSIRERAINLTMRLSA